MCLHYSGEDFIEEVQTSRYNGLIPILFKVKNTRQASESKITAHDVEFF